MSVTVTIEGTACTVQKLASGVIRVSHPTPQWNAMHGVGTGGEYWYLVHPCQPQQYEFWNGQLPPGERAMPEGGSKEARPWWSSGTGERANLRE